MSAPLEAVLYGIPNCDTVKKARSWLDAHKVAYQFHDFKKSAISAELIQFWLNDIEWEVLLNRKGTTWRALPEERKSGITSVEAAIALMREQPSVIKRPVLCTGGKCYVGFSDQLYKPIFKK
ncbi:ArsC family reductase [soil metagenome]